MNDDDLQLVRGTLDVLVLRALAQGRAHGYAVAEWIHAASGEELQVEDRALYLALHRLEDRGWVTAEWGLSENNRKAKYYALTRPGRKQLERQSAQWDRYARAVFRVLEGGAGT